MLCDFIGIDYSDSLLDGKGFKIPGYTASQHTLVGKNLDKSRIEKWKKTHDYGFIIRTAYDFGAIFYY